MMRVSRVASILACGAVLSIAGCSAILGDFSVGDAGGPPDGGGTADGTTIGPDGGGDDATTFDGSGGETGGPEGGGNPGPESGATDADADAGPPWTPAALDQAGALAAWFEASSGNLVLSSGTVGVWKDLSANHNDASTTSGGPSVDASAVSGHDAVHFTARNVILTMKDAASLQFGSDQVFLEAVARASGGYGYFWSKVTTGASGGGSYYQSGLELFTVNGTNDAGASIYPAAHISNLAGNEVDWPGPGLLDAKFHRVALRRIDSSTLSLGIDDQPAVQASTGAFDISQVGNDVEIGGVGYGTFLAKVDLEIAEMLVVHSPQTGVVGDADVANVQAYLKQKYGL